MALSKQPKDRVQFALYSRLCSYDKKPKNEGRSDHLNTLTKKIPQLFREGCYEAIIRLEQE